MPATMSVDSLKLSDYFGLFKWLSTKFISSLKSIYITLSQIKSHYYKGFYVSDSTDISRSLSDSTSTDTSLICSFLTTVIILSILSLVSNIRLTN